MAMKTKELRIGVIGVAGRGGLAQHAHKPEQGVKLVAGADVVPKFLQEFKDKVKADFVTENYKELLARKDIDAVFICSPDWLHEEQSVAALEAGKHVYLEKPMAITVKGCDRILKAAYKNKVKLFLGHNMRHMNFVLKMKEMIEDGMIGEVMAGWCRHFVGYGGDFYFKDWHADRRNTTSLLLQKAAHDIDVLHWLCGGYSRNVQAMGDLTLYSRINDKDHNPAPAKRDWSDTNWPPLKLRGLHPIIDVEDISMVNMRLDNGVFCCYQQCHYTPDYWRNYTIIGTEGRIENFGDGHDETHIKLYNQKGGYSPKGNAQFFTPATKGSHGGADPKIVQEFVDYVRFDIKINTSPIAARYSVATGCEATYSLRHGGIPRTVPDVDKEIRKYFEKDVKKALTK